MKKPIFVFLTIFVPSLVFGYTPNTGRPRIMLLTSGVTDLATRCDTGGSAVTAYGEIKTWVDASISDNIAGISQTVDYNNPADENMAIHLYRNSLCHIVQGHLDGGYDDSYGQRVADLLDYLASSGSGDFSTSTTASDGETVSYPALAVAFDWCYDQLDYDSNKAAIISYLDTIMDNNGLIDPPGDPSYDQYKSEEKYFGGFIAATIDGESGVNDTTVTTQMDAFEDWLKDWARGHDEAGYDGGSSLGGTYLYIQITWFRALFFELWRTYGQENMWTTVDSDWDSDNDGSDNSRYMYNWMVLCAPPNLRQIPFGQGNSNPTNDGHIWTEQSYIYANQYNDPIAQYWHNAIATANSDYNRDAYYDDRVYHNFLWCLWRDDTTASLSTASEANFFTGMDQVCFRGGFTFDGGTDIYIITDSLTKQDYTHWTVGGGGFVLHRGVDQLMPHPGTYGWGTAHTINFMNKPVSHCAIVVDDTNYSISNEDATYSGFTRASTPQAAANDFGSIDRFQSEDDNYAYAFQNLTNLYKNESETTDMDRQLVFVDDAYLVVYDYVDKVTAGDEVKMFWQTGTAEPARASDDWGAVGGGCYIDKTSNVVISWTVGSSDAWWEMLAPTSNVTFRQVGGVNGSGCEYADLGYTQRDVGSSANWRFETILTESISSVTSFVVIEPKATSGSQTNTALLGTIDSDFVGCEIRATTRVAVLFTKDTLDESESSFTVSDSSGTLKGVVCNLSADTYDVTQTGFGVVGDDVVVDSNGILYFTADLSNGSAFTIAAASGGAGGGGGSTSSIAGGGTGSMVGGGNSTINGGG